MSYTVDNDLIEQMTSTLRDANEFLERYGHNGTAEECLELVNRLQGLVQAKQASQAERKYCGSCGHPWAGPLACCADEGDVLPRIDLHQAGAVQAALKRRSKVEKVLAHAKA